jgi:Rrf2 family nitric oxide-sensitive transcriptional repressor
MQLTRFTDLGMRVLMYLANVDGSRQGAVTIAEIAAQYQVPHNHMIKVVSKLSKLGWVAAVRGRKGGLTLGIDARLLTLGRVLRELEHCEELIDCGGGNCTLHGHCLLKGALDVALDAFFAALDRYSLADLAGSDTGVAIINLYRQYDRRDGQAAVPNITANPEIDQ